MADSSTARTVHRSVLFADIVSSTALYESLGDSAARKLVRGCIEVLTETAKAFSGNVVKSLGDGILCAFEAEQEAVWAAVAMCEKSGDRDLEIRVGVHCGGVLEDRSDIFGDAVNTASRIAALAKPSEILISRAMKEALPPFLQGIVRRVPPVSVKGKRDPIELFAILRGDTSASGDPSQTMPLGQTVIFNRAGAESGKLELSHGGERLTIGPDVELAIGRDPESGLAVPSKHVSRRHARIYFRQGKFMLADQSANGTFLVPDGQSKLHLLREEAILNGAGRVYLGADPDATPSEPIYYQTS